MLQRLSVNKTECIKDTSQFNEYFIKDCNEDSDEGCCLEVDAQYREKLHKRENDLPFLPEGLTKSKNFLLITACCMIKQNISFT